MSKKRPRKRREAWRTVSLPRSRPPRRQRDELQSAFQRADRWIAEGRAREAVALLKPLLDTYPREAELHYYIGYARFHTGDVLGGLAGYERAVELSGDPSYWFPLAFLYAEAEYRAHALRAFRQALKHPDTVPTIARVRRAVAQMEQDIATIARDIDRSPEDVEEGLYQMEDGQRALDGRDYPASIAAGRRAIQLLGDWPPPYNNLSLALFYDGQPQEAIAAARRVLAYAPDNVHALGNAIRFLAWTGQEAEARALWARLKDVVPRDPGQRFKMASAAAILGEDESVYQLLRLLDKPNAGQVVPPQFVARAQFHLAIAEANTGRRRASRRLRALQETIPGVAKLVAALEDGRPGPGWAERFPYDSVTDLLPDHALNEFVGLTMRQEDLPAPRFRQEVERFAARYPQIVLVAQKLIWEEEQADAGIGTLTLIDNPMARAVLRRFGLSQAGEDEARVQALMHLVQVGEIAVDEKLHVWFGGEWRDVQIRPPGASDESEEPYSDEVADLLDQGLGAFREDDYDRAESLFRRVLALEPRAKQAYNNLGTIYSRRDDRTQAEEMFRAALEIDPLYAFPRCNLAHNLLDDDNVDGAEDVLKPLAGVSFFQPQEASFYAYTQARVWVKRRDYDAAREALEAALRIAPDYEQARNLLEWVDSARTIQANYQSFLDRQRKRDRNVRAQLQGKLSTPHPSLSEALSLYIKNALTGMARVVFWWGGWATLRKAELVQQLVETLCDEDELARIVGGLGDDEQNALREVLAGGGTMPWKDFDARYGNDLDESRYWEWHTPETVMGRLRMRGLVVETTVDRELLIAVPVELRQGLSRILAPRDR